MGDLGCDIHEDHDDERVLHEPDQIPGDGEVVVRRPEPTGGYCRRRDARYLGLIAVGHHSPFEKERRRSDKGVEIESVDIGIAWRTLVTFTRRIDVLDEPTGLKPSFRVATDMTLKPKLFGIHAVGLERADFTGCA